jgi:predicted nucleotidyltransferase
MEAKLAQKQAEVAALCRQFGVSRLEVFGSAAAGGFDPGRSDYDFIARFKPQPGLSMGGRFLGFSDALEAMLERKIDLMTDRPIDNPYLRAAVDATRITIYEESPAEASV